MKQQSIWFNYNSTDTDGLGKERGDVINSLLTVFQLLRKNQ